jgi:hypothetical protein
MDGWKWRGSFACFCLSFHHTLRAGEWLWQGTLDWTWIVIENEECRFKPSECGLVPRESRMGSIPACVLPRPAGRSAQSLHFQVLPSGIEDPSSLTRQRMAAVGSRTSASTSTSCRREAQKQHDLSISPTRLLPDLPTVDQVGLLVSCRMPSVLAPEASNHACPGPPSDRILLQSLLCPKHALTRLTDLRAGGKHTADGKQHPRVLCGNTLWELLVDGC